MVVNPPTKNPQATNPEKQSWIIRGYREGDEKQAVPLFNRIFNKSISEAHYRWKVIDSPWPSGTAPTWFADADGLIVGQYASTAMRLWLQGSEVPIVHVCDVMTHPDFRRQGILSAIGETAHKTWQENGVKLVTGFPHKGWGSRSKYLNWQTMYYSGWMWRPLRPGQLLGNRFQLPNFLTKTVDTAAHLVANLKKPFSRTPAADITISEVETPGPEFDTLWHKLKQSYEATVVRDTAWVTYRYADAPEKEYRLLLARRNNIPAGYLAYRLRRLNDSPVAYIADLFTARDDTACRRALIQTAVDMVYDAGAKAVLAVAPPIKSIRKSFSQTGFYSRFGKFDVSIVPLADDLPLEVFRDPERWFSMGGDFDII